MRHSAGATDATDGNDSRKLIIELLLVDSSTGKVSFHTPRAHELKLIPHHCGVRRNTRVVSARDDPRGSLTPRWAYMARISLSKIRVAVVLYVTR